MPNAQGPSMPNTPTPPEVRAALDGVTVVLTYGEDGTFLVLLDTAMEFPESPVLGPQMRILLNDFPVFENPPPDNQIHVDDLANRLVQVMILTDQYGDEDAWEDTWERACALREKLGR